MTKNPIPCSIEKYLFFYKQNKIMATSIIIPIAALILAWFVLKALFNVLKIVVSTTAIVLVIFIVLMLFGYAPQDFMKEVINLPQTISQLVTDTRNYLPQNLDQLVTDARNYLPQNLDQLVTDARNYLPEVSNQLVIKVRSLLGL